MAGITSYPSGTLYLNDYLIGTDRENVNDTRSYKVSDVVSTILASLGDGTITSISTESSKFITATGGPITTTGTINLALSATGLSADAAVARTQFLRGDNTWSLPGPAAKNIIIQYNGAQITSDVNSINYTGNVSASAANLNVTVNMPGNTDSVDNVIAGTAISVSNPTGNVTIGNTGVTQARAGGNVTLSGGTGSVTISTTANAGSVTSVNPGLGIDAITNNTSNPEIDVDFTGANNYISQSESITVSTPGDIIEYNDLTASSVKSVEISDIPTDVLTAVNKYIDDADENKLKNATDTFNSTEKAQNMVSLTITEYNALVSGGIVDENTVYFIVGAGTSFTVNPVVTNNITGGTAGVDYTLSTTPSSVSGVSGTPYTFTTTINAGSGTYTAGNLPLTTSDTINSSSGNPYNKAITATGSWSAPAANTGQARLNITLQSGSSGTSIATAGFNSIWRYKSANSEPLDLNPIPAQSSGSYTFNAELEIMDANYEFVSGPEYEITEGSSNFQTGATTFTGGLVFNNTVTNVTQIIKAGYNIKQFLYTLNQVDSIVDSDGVTGGGAGVEYNLSFSGDLTGTYDINTPITGTLTATTTGNFQFTDTTTSKSVSITPFNITSITNETLTITGTTESTIPVTKTVTLDYTDNISGGSSNYTLSPIDGDTRTGAIGSAYNFGTITATPATGYYFSVAFNATQTGGTEPLSGTIPSVDSIAGQTLTGTVAQINANLSQSQLAPASNISYNTSYFAQGGGSSTNVTTSGTNGSNTGALTIGNGTVNATVSKTAPTGQASGNGVITWNYKPSGGSFGPPVNTYTFSSGDYVYASYTYTGVSNGDELKTIITEN